MVTPMSFKFEKLEVWQKAIEFDFHIHELTRNFPKEELYMLTSQIKRAADSIALNIAGSAP
jgi:four helix bundle protein